MTVQHSSALEPIRVPAWAVLVAAVAVFAAYLLALDNGAVLAQAGETVHELFHDARHFVGVPCH